MNQRVFWGAIGGLFLLFVIYAGGIWFTMVLGLLVILAVLEYGELLKKQQMRPQTEVIMFVSLLMLALVYVLASHGGPDRFEALRHSEQALNLILVIVFFITLINELLRGAPEEGLVNASVNLFGTVYIGLMFAYILLLRFIPGQRGFFVFFTVLVTWANDSTAYFIGINFGKHKLSPRISPKKSIEGSIGGLAGGVLAALIMGIFYKQPLWLMLWLGILVVAAGQFGDLIESIIKRNAGVKDSGSFLPGHGGVLDRFDSLLLAAPVVYYAATYVLPYL